MVKTHPRRDKTEQPRSIALMAASCSCVSVSGIVDGWKTKRRLVIEVGGDGEAWRRKTLEE